MLFRDFPSWFLVVCLASASEVQEEVKAKPGKDVTLQCQGPTGVTVTLLEWSRPELRADGYVFFYRNSRSYENYQHQFYRGRVELRDKLSVQDGDVSVILKNVNINDTGTYKCRIISSSIINGERITSELSHLINLKVTESGDTAENTWDKGNKDGKNSGEGNKGGDNSDELNQGVIVGVVVASVVLVGGIVFLGVLSCRKHKSLTKKDSYKRAAEQKGGPV